MYFCLDIAHREVVGLTSVFVNSRIMFIWLDWTGFLQVLSCDCGRVTIGEMYCNLQLRSLVLCLLQNQSIELMRAFNKLNHIYKRDVSLSHTFGSIIYWIVIIILSSEFSGHRKYILFNMMHYNQGNLSIEQKSCYKGLQWITESLINFF